MKVKLDGIAETLLITLYIRAKDYSSDKSVLKDKLSYDISKEIEYDFSKFDKAWGSYYGTLARAKIMDDEISEYIYNHPNCSVISIGCGLDTRFNRIDNGKIKWYNLDLPEVIEFRKNFFKENKRVVNIPVSVFDRSWTDFIEKDNRDLIIFSEGVFMYFDETEIKEILNILVDNFESFELHLDLISKFIVNRSQKHDTVRNMNAEFKWGVKDGSEVVDICPELNQVDLINFTKEMKRILPLSKKIFVPFFYLFNNRLGIYRKEANS